MTPDPRCVCGAPVAFTVRRLNAGFVGPYEHVCPQCAPAPTDCAKGSDGKPAWHDFYAGGREAESVRQADVDRAQGGAA